MKFCNCRRTLDIYNQGLLIRPNVITRKSLLHLGQKVTISETLLHLGSFITFWPSTNAQIDWTINSINTVLVDASNTIKSCITKFGILKTCKLHAEISNTQSWILDQCHISTISTVLYTKNLILVLSLSGIAPVFIEIHDNSLDLALFTITNPKVS